MKAKSHRVTVEMYQMQRKLTEYWDLYQDDNQMTLDHWIEDEKNNT